MAKMRKELVLKVTVERGTNMSVTHYPSLSRKKQKNLINRLHKKGKGVLFSSGQSEFYWPQTGITAIHTKVEEGGTYGAVVVYGKVANPLEVPYSEYPLVWDDKLDDFIDRKAQAFLQENLNF